MWQKIMIPMAAFAVTVTGASAFSSDVLENLNLTDSQISALEEAHELRTEGADRDEVQALLEDAGIDQDTMREVHEAMHEYRDEQRQVVDEALDADDYDAFLAAIEGSPLEDAINSEADFEIFKEAHELMQSGDREAAEELFDELGLERPQGFSGRGGHGPHGCGEGGGFGSSNDDES